LIEKLLLTLSVLLAFHFGSKAQCNATFTVSVDSVSGTVQCTNTSVVGSPDSPTVYTWYEIPGIVLSNSVNPNITLSEGNHTLCLKIVNDGCTDSFCAPVVIPRRFCKADFSYLTNSLTGEVQFTNTSIGHNSSYIWSFGDGVSFSTDTNPTHIFENGWYYTCLNIQNTDSSCSDVTCNFIRIQKPTPSPCVANFDYTYDSINSKKVYFFNQTFSDSSVHVIWLFPEGKTDSSEQTSHTFNTVGNYTVCMLVSGPLCADSVCKTIEVINILPVCDAEFSYQLFADTVLGGAKRIAVFANHSNGNNLAYKWLVNDSLVSDEVNPVYYYPQNGTYKVCLVAYSQNFCSDSMCQNITIQSSTTGITEVNNRCLLNLSPNPAQSEVLVDLEYCKEEVDYICVYNAMGTNRVSIVKPQSATRISLTGWAKGMYIVEVKTSGNLYRKKLSIL
jgi:PKD repeat protein